MPKNLVLLLAVLLGFSLALLPVAAQDTPVYEGPLWDAHAHPIPWTKPPLDVAAVDELWKELKVVGGFLSLIHFNPGGSERAVRIAREQFSTTIFPFVAVEDFPKWVAQDPVHIKAQLAKIEKLLATGHVFGIGEIFTQAGTMRSLSCPCIEADSPQMMELVALAVRYNVILQVHHTIVPVGDEAKGPRLDDWERFLAKSTKAKLLMAHAGITPEWLSDTGPKGGPAKLREWLTKYPNLFVELSWAAQGAYYQRGIVFAGAFNPKLMSPMTSDGRTLSPEWRNLLEEFSDRFMAWGSDATFNYNVDGTRRALTQRELIEVVKLGVRNTREILGQLSPETARKIGYQNARNLLSYR